MSQLISVGGDLARSGAGLANAPVGLETTPHRIALYLYLPRTLDHGARTVLA